MLLLDVLFMFFIHVTLQIHMTLGPVALNMMSSFKNNCADVTFGCYTAEKQHCVPKIAVETDAVSGPLFLDPCFLQLSQVNN